jgi:hypothetical protein
MELLVPNKHHQSRQHKFTKAKYKITNWSEYTEALRRRGNVTLWFTDDAIAHCTQKKFLASVSGHKSIQTLPLNVAWC